MFLAILAPRSWVRHRMIDPYREVAMSDRGYINPQLVWEPAELHARLNDPKLCLIDSALPLTKK
jgi:hypothetical protein